MDRSITQQLAERHGRVRRYELATEIGARSQQLPHDWQQFLTATDRICADTDVAFGAVRATTADELAQGMYGNGRDIEWVGGGK